MGISDHLHDLIDDLELIRLEAKEQARGVFGRIDPVRMADPADAEFDVALRDALHDVLLDAMDKAYQCGGEAGRRISGRSADSSQIGVLLNKAVNVATYKLNGALGRANSSLDEWVAVSQAEGLSPQTTVDSIARSLTAAGGLEGAVPALGLSLTADLLAICGGLFRRAISAASRAGQFEVYADPSEAVFSG